MADSRPLHSEHTPQESSDRWCIQPCCALYEKAAGSPQSIYKTHVFTSLYSLPTPSQTIPYVRLILYSVLSAECIGECFRLLDLMELAPEATQFGRLYMREFEMGALPQIRPNMPQPQGTASMEVTSVSDAGSSDGHHTVQEDDHIRCISPGLGSHSQGQNSE